MTGADLRCVECGAQARDVSHTMTLDNDPYGLMRLSDMNIKWTCTNGHEQFVALGFNPLTGAARVQRQALSGRKGT